MNPSMNDLPHIMPPSLSRRDMLCRCGTGFGALALADLLSQTGFFSSVARAGEHDGNIVIDAANPLLARPSPLPAKAKRVIHLFFNGGPSHVDTWDPKPMLDKYAWQKPTHGEPADRAKNRFGDALAVQIQETRPERH